MLPNSAQSWFQNRRYFGAALGSDVFIVDLELPPATQIENVNLPRGARRAKSVVVYANYLHPNGQAGIQLGNFKSITVELIKESIEIRGSKCIGRSTLPR